MTLHVCSYMLAMQVVLVHGFFSTSLLAHAWRVLYDYMKEKELIIGEEALSSQYTAPTFDMQVRAHNTSRLMPYMPV